jgi:hypothetical protein
MNQKRARLYPLCTMVNFNGNYPDNIMSQILGIAIFRTQNRQSSLQDVRRCYIETAPSLFYSHLRGDRMLATAAASLLLPLALGTSLGPTPPSLHHNVRAMVTGYNTVPEQTDGTPCVAASGADICGRHDAVACPRRIKLGTTVEIRGTTYVCEDRLAKKYDTRFDISCDKDMACPYQVAGWTIIKVYDDGDPAPAAAPKAKTAVPAVKKAFVISRGERHRPLRSATVIRRVHRAAKKLLASAGNAAVVLHGRG